MQFPIEMFPVLFAIPRTSGWLAHYTEGLDRNSRIVRPRQLYDGQSVRDYVGIDARS
jgi:citrate synthase